MPQPTLRLTATTWPRLIAASHAVLGRLPVENRDKREAGGGCVCFPSPQSRAASLVGAVSRWVARGGWSRGGPGVRPGLAWGKSTCRAACGLLPGCLADLADRDCTVASVPVGAKRAGARGRRGSGRRRFVKPLNWIFRSHLSEIDRCIHKQCNTQ